MVIFDHTYPKIIEPIFWICTTSMQKINLFHLFILEVQSIFEFRDKTSHTHFWQCQPKIFWSTFMRICMSMKKIRLYHWLVLEIWLIKKFCNLIGKSGYFTDSFWRYDWLKNPAIWSAENILAHYLQYLRNKNFPKYGICVRTQQIKQILIIEQIR